MVQCTIRQSVHTLCQLYDREGQAERERERGRNRQTDRRGAGEIKCSRVHNTACDEYGQQ